MNKNAKPVDGSGLEAQESRLEIWMYFGMALVLVGVIAEAIPDVLSSAEQFVSVIRRIGETFVAVGLLAEFIVDIRLKDCRSQMKILADRELEQLRNQTAEANLARAKIEARFRWRSIPPESAEELKSKLSSFVGTRVDIFVYGLKRLEVRVFTEQLTAALSASGVAVLTWEGGSVMDTFGSDIQFAIATDSTSEEKTLLEHLVHVIGSFLFSLGITTEHLYGGFSSKDGPSLIGGSPRRWDSSNVAKLRIQIREKEFLTSTQDVRPVTPPQE